LMEKSPGIIIEVNDPLGNQGTLRMNHLLPPFNNPKIRQAVLHTIDQERYLRAGIGNPRFYKTCYSVYACGSTLETDAGYGPYKKANLDAAKKLLAEGNYDGTPVVIMQPTDVPMLSAFSLVTAQRLRDIGMKVDLQAMDWSTLTSRRVKKDPVDKGGWNIFHTWWIGADCTNPVLESAISGGGVERAWFGWPTDPQIEKMRSAFARESDPAKQKALADRIQVRALEVGTHGNLGTFFVPVAYRDNVKGVIKSPVQFFWNIDVAR
ncbi:MAG: ABC transporter substrate-binding protein, partial [Burkholderiales bacterium]